MLNILFRSPSDEFSVEKHEACLLVKAIRSTNLPKFVIEDVPVFEQILVDLFPGLMTPLSDERIFQVIFNVRGANVARITAESG